MKVQTNSENGQTTTVLSQADRDALAKAKTVVELLAYHGRHRASEEAERDEKLADELGRVIRESQEGDPATDPDFEVKDA